MGAQLRVYRQKITSAQTTKKITRAMELIAASRIQRALNAANAAYPYERSITRAVQALVTFSSRIDHPVFHERSQIRRSAVLVITSDRGLAGAYNANVIREVEGLEALLRSEGKDIDFYLVGRKAVGYFEFRNKSYVRAWTGMTDAPTIDTAIEIRKELMPSYLTGGEAGGVDEIFVIGNRFVSMMLQTPEVVRLLPLKIVDTSSTDPDYPHEVFPLYTFEPDSETVLNKLVPRYITAKLFSALLQASAAKHAATQKAMKSASDNADKLITTYTRLQNNARQAEITQQITEIVGGADALATNEDE